MFGHCVLFVVLWAGGLVYFDTIKTKPNQTSQVSGQSVSGQSVSFSPSLWKADCWTKIIRTFQPST